MKILSTILMTIVALALGLPANKARAADGSPVWTNYFNGTGNAHDGVTAMALDADENVYVTGYSDGKVRRVKDKGRGANKLVTKNEGTQAAASPSGNSKGWEYRFEKRGSKNKIEEGWETLSSSKTPNDGTRFLLRRPRK